MLLLLFLLKGVLDWDGGGRLKWWDELRSCISSLLSIATETSVDNLSSSFPLPTSLKFPSSSLCSVAKVDKWLLLLLLLKR